MNCNELMIGDLVKYKLDYPAKLKANTIHKVCGITPKHVLFEISKDEIHEEYITHIEPIPITAEILEKNGFDWVEDKDEFSDSEYEGYMALCSDEEIRFYPKGSMDRYCVLEIGYIERTYIRLYINYVHELQHALKLCGLNDLANNFYEYGKTYI